MLRVQTYNIHLFPPWLAQLEACFFPASYQPDSDLRFAGLIAALRTTDADVILLTELWDPAYIAQLKAHLVDVWPHLYAPDRVPWYRALNSGLVLLSKLRITEASFAPFAKSAGVDHLAGKGILTARLENGACVLGTHLQANYKDSSKYNGIQRAQIEQLLQHAGSVRPHLVLGDFNIRPATKRFRMLSQGLQQLGALTCAVPNRPSQTLLARQAFAEAYSVAKDRRQNYIFAHHLVWLYEDPLTEAAFKETYCYTDTQNERQLLSDHLPVLALVAL